MADRIAEQLTDTRSVLTTRFFATDPPRIDGELQRARLTNLLHYYADRAAAHELIDASRVVDIHKWIDRIEEQQENPEMSLRGYVIALAGDEGFPSRHQDIPMTVITAKELGEVGLSAVFNAPSDMQKATDGGQPPEETFDPAPRPAKPPAEEPVDLDETSTQVGDSTPDTGDDRTPAGDDLTSAGDDVTPAPVHERSEPGHRSPSDPVEVTLGDDANGTLATWRISTKGSPHAFIVGIPGQGKSVTTRKIISDFAEQGLHH